VILLWVVIHNALASNAMSGAHVVCQEQGIRGTQHSIGKLSIVSPEIAFIRSPLRIPEVSATSRSLVDRMDNLLKAHS
jgi:hypothetical protein